MAAFSWSIADCLFAVWLVDGMDGCAVLGHFLVYSIADCLFAIGQFSMGG